MIPENYSTTDFYLASYLYAAGYPFVSLDVDDGGRGTFTFENVSKDDLVAFYNSSETHRVSARGLIAGIKEVRSFLYNSKDVPSERPS